jgi:hypothetical protein
VGLEKKTKLMRHFRGYLARDGRSAVEKTAGGLFDSFAEQDGSLPNSSSNGDEQSVTPRGFTARRRGDARGGGSIVVEFVDVFVAVPAAR